MTKSESGVTTTYNYGATDRLASVQLPDGRTATYKYDPFGRRVSKQVGTQTTYFLYADEGLIGEYGANGSFNKGYGWRPDGIWGTDPVFMVENGEHYFYHNDQLGTPQKMTDVNGDVVWSATYEAFGNAEVDPASTVISNLRFPGQYWDEETGLQYNWHRHYDFRHGRYVSVDPIGFKSRTPLLYSYAANNPLLIYDNDGYFGKFYNPDKFHWYGNYGGPGWTGNAWRSWEDIPTTESIPQPLDSQDWAYFRHDQCYGECRTKCGKAKQWECFNTCDNKLVEDLLVLPRNPKEWEFPPGYIRTSSLHRDAAIPVFVAQQIKRGLSDAMPKIVKGLKALRK